jgi:hypothetical protein
MTNVIQQLKTHGQSLFDGRGSLLSLLQEIGENFYPERADFTTTHQIGREFAANLMTSFPLLMRRDLGNAFGAMLRPSAKDWFKCVSKRQDKLDSDGKKWLAWFTKLEKNAMYDRVAMFQRATSTADHDFAAFGMAVIQCRWIRPRNGQTPHLHHQCWHLRDVAWQENALGVIDTVFRKWHPAAIDIVRHFPDKAHQDIKDRVKTKPFDTFEIWHTVMPLDIYQTLDGALPIKQPWVNIFFDPKHEVVLEAVGAWVMEYVIPRWSRVTSFQYAYSPPTIAGLPDGRLIQSMVRVIYDAGEKAVDPPLIGVREAIRSDIDIRSGGFTAVDPEFAEHLENVLRPLNRDIKGFNIGPELVKDIREQLKDAFFLNKLNLPSSQMSKEMTAFEVGQRVQEYIRNALPLFEPVETDYNGQLCETDMQLILHNEPRIRASIPKSLGIGSPDDFGFIFESPLREAVDKAKLGQFTEAQQILTAAIALDKTAAFIMDGKTATRDVLDAVVPADWLRSEDEVDQMANAQAAAQQRQELLNMMQQGAGVAKDSAAAASDAATAMQTTGPA